MPRGIKNPLKVLSRDSDIAKKIEAEVQKGKTLSLIEFSVAPESVRENYVRYLLKNRKKIEDYILDWCKGDLKKEVVTSILRRGSSVEKNILDTLDAEQLEIYFESRMLSSSFFNNYEVEMMTPKQIVKYHKAIVKNGIFIDIKTFEGMDEKLRIAYIINMGVLHCDSEIKDWYYLWKKSKGRDYLIEQILLD